MGFIYRRLNGVILLLVQLSLLATRAHAMVCLVVGDYSTANNNWNFVAFACSWLRTIDAFRLNQSLLLELKHLAYLRTYSVQYVIFGALF